MQTARISIIRTKTPVRLLRIMQDATPYHLRISMILPVESQLDVWVKHHFADCLLPNGWYENPLMDITAYLEEATS